MLICYNKGCGKKFESPENKEDSCTYHPGAPVFHDAYKIWSCCNKKSTDFTEFLNIKGCTISYHNPEKPPEPERYVPDKETAKDIIEVRAPQTASMERPSIDTPLILMKPNIAQNLLNQFELLKQSSHTKNENLDIPLAIPLGTKCKNNACKQTYEGPDSFNTPCLHHPGMPVFHEGLKFWTCCTKRTTDFSDFLAQEGCTDGDHVWFKKSTEKGQVKCRLDWHQTSSSVVVSVFAKKIDPYKSKIQISPVRLKIDLYFPEENGTYQQDIELKGIVNVDKSSVSMFASKVEINMIKAEIGSWSKLEIPKSNTEQKKQSEEKQKEQEKINQAQYALDSVDLSDIGPYN